MTDKTEDKSKDTQKAEKPQQSEKYSEEKKKRIRERRRGLLDKGPLYVSVDELDPNYHYRRVNHSQGRSNIERMQDLGYEFVYTKTENTRGLNQGSQFGSVDERRVGDGQTGILMRIPIDLYEEGREILEEKNKRIDAAVASQKEGLHGESVTKTIEK